MRRVGLQREALRGIELALERRRFALQESAQRRRRLVQELPAFLEGDPDRGVMPGGGTWSHPDDETAAGEEVYGGQALRQRNRPPHDRRRHRGHEVHPLRDREHRGQRRRTIEPGAGEAQVVVRREGPEAQVLGGLGIIEETP